MEGIFWIVAIPILLAALAILLVGGSVALGGMFLFYKGKRTVGTMLVFVGVVPFLCFLAPSLTFIGEVLTQLLR